MKDCARCKHGIAIYVVIDKPGHYEENVIFKCGKQTKKQREIKAICPLFEQKNR